MSAAPPATIKAPAIAVPTIALASINLGLYGVATGLAIAGSLALPVAVAINTLFAYVAYTALHESVHRNVDRNRAWLNTLVGMFGALPLFHNVELHKLTHLGHHAHLNNPEKDTDHWVATSNPLVLLLKCSTLFLVHYRDGIALARKKRDGSQRLRRALLQNTVTLAPIVAVGFFVSWQLAFFVQVLPGLIAATILAITFDWLPHHPHDSGDAREGTRVIELQGVLNKPFTWIYLWQNYHRSHHVRPTIPFYLYRQHHELDIER